MSEFRARIGRIRMKNGGAEVRLLRQEREVPDRRGELTRHARITAEASTPDDPLVGHMIIGFFASGKSNVGVYYDPDTCPIPRMMLPAWIEEIVRREMIVDAEAHDIFNEMFEWQE